MKFILAALAFPHEHPALAGIFLGFVLGVFLCLAAASVASAMMGED